MDPEDWLYEKERTMIANGTANNVKLNYVTAQLQEQALRWFVRDQELPDDVRGRINAWDDQTDNGTIARIITTKFKARFVSEDQKEEKKRDWYFQWERMKQGQGETIDAYIKRYRKLVERAEREITEEEQTIKFTEGLLPVYYSFATMGNAVNLIEAISNAKKAERGVTRQLTPQQEFITDNRIYEEMNKEVIQKDEDKLEKMFKEMKIQLLQEVRGNNSYRNTGYRNNRERICYKCGKKGHYAPNCQEEKTQEKKCYICGSKNHLVRECNNRENQRDNIRNNTRSNERNNNRDNSRNNERHLNYLGIDSSEGSEIPTEGEFSSDEDNERRFYTVSTRSQEKYRNARTNKRDKLNNNEYWRIDKLAEQNNRRLNSESQKELKLQDDENDSSDDDNMNSQREPVKDNLMN